MNILLALIPLILVAAGLFFLVPVLMSQYAGKTTVRTRRQNVFMALGILLLFFGIVLYLIPAIRSSFRASSSPAILGVTIRTRQEAGALLYDQEINFYDEDGNTNLVEWNLVNLSDPAQRPYMQIQNSVVKDVPAVQKIRSTVKRTWNCEGRVYEATLEVSLVDEDGNRSEPVRYTIECK